MRRVAPIVVVAVLVLVVVFFGFFERYAPRYDAEYVGAAVCGECHTQIYPEWQRSPHANMLREPDIRSVVGDFSNATWTLDEADRQNSLDAEPAARMFSDAGKYFMELRNPGEESFEAFQIDYVVGYQYRQVYLTREAGGVLRRLPLQWSVPRQEFFPYWNLQEGSTPSVQDLRAQMTSMNSAWNLFCARCHTTHLTIHEKNTSHTFANVEWTDKGIACEACHGPGSLHQDYFSSNYINRIAAWINSKLRGQPVAYIANANKLNKGEAMSVCGRCHGADIFLGETDVYRTFEPGYSREGHTNDLSAYFRSAPLTPNRNVATVETYSDGEAKGIGMLFRSLIESKCYQQAEVRCYDCHNPHDNKLPAKPGMLFPSDSSNDYCMGCHGDLREIVDDHTGHEPGSAGSFCYDCHMPKIITKLATGIWETTRTHRMSFIPEPPEDFSDENGSTPNVCLQCHGDSARDLQQARHNIERFGRENAKQLESLRE